MRIQLTAAGLALVVASASLARADDPPAPAPAPAEAASETVWVPDFDKAVAQAKAEKKDLLVDFTGSDWCIWCKRLHDEIFSKDEFLTAAKKDYVLVALDFPNSPEVKAKVPNPQRNAELRDKYKIQGYPTVLLMTPDGDVFGRTGYQKGGPGPFVENMAKLRAEGLPALKSAKDLVAEVDAAKDADKPAAYAKAIAALDAVEPGAATADVLAGPVKAALQSDPENKAGLAAKAAKALFKSDTADDSVLAAVEKLDAKNELGLLEQAVIARGMRLRSLDDVKAWAKRCDDLFALGEIKDKKVAKQLAANCAFVNYQHLKDLDKAKLYAKKLQDMGFEPNEDRLKALVERILGTDAGPAPGKDDGKGGEQGGK